MPEKRLVILIAGAIFSLALAVTVFLAERGVFEPDVSEVKVITDFDNAIQKTVAITIEHGKAPVTLVFDGAGSWYVGEMDGYPANPDKVNALLGALRDMTFGSRIAKKEADMEKFGLVSPDKENAASFRVSLVSDKSDITESIVISPPDKADGKVFMRKTQSGEVRRTDFPFALSGKPTDWVDTSLFNLNSDDIVKITMIDPVPNPKEEVVFEREGAKAPFVIKQNSAKERDIKPQDGDKLLRAFYELNMEDARMITEENSPVIKTIFKTEAESADGDIYGLNFIDFNGEVWFQLYSSDKELNARHNAWIYKLPFKKVLELLPPPSMAEK